MRIHLLTLFFCFSLTACVFAQGRESQELAFAGTSIGPGDDATNVIFYPNPVKRMLNVRFPERGFHTVRIYNILGDKITEKTVQDEYIVEMDLSELPRGMFFLSYEQDARMVTKTFSKN